MFLFVNLAFDLFHFLVNSEVWVHGIAFAQHLCAKDEEKDCGGESGELLGKESRCGVAEEGGQDGHGEEGGKSGGEDEDARVAHAHDDGDEEGFVANFGKDDHGEGEDKGVERLDERLFAARETSTAGRRLGGRLLAFSVGHGRLEVVLADGEIQASFGVGRGNVVWFIREVRRFLQ